jgi:hypothetical protein
LVFGHSREKEKKKHKEAAEKFGPLGEKKCFSFLPGDEAGALQFHWIT